MIVFEMIKHQKAKIQKLINRQKMGIQETII